MTHVVELRRGFVAWLVSTREESVYRYLTEAGYSAAVSLFRPPTVKLPVFQWGRHISMARALSKSKFNVFAQKRDIQVIEVGATISRDQALLAYKHGKYILINISNFDTRRLTQLLDVVEPEYTLISIEIQSVSDIVNPIDLSYLLEELSGVDWLNNMYRGVEVLVDLLFKRSICINQVW